MKKSITIILAILTLCILLVILWFTTTQNKTKDTSAASSSPATESTLEAASIEVLSLEQANIDSIDVTADENTLTYIAGKENWSLKGYEDLSLDQSELNSKAGALIKITASRSISNANLAEYGLDHPAKTATYHLKDGSTKVLSVGNLSLDNSNVYIMLDSEPTTVYLTSSSLNEYMISDINAYRKKELENYESASIHDLTISGSAFDTLSLKLSKKQNDHYTSYDLSTDTLKDVTTNTNKVEELTKALPSFTVSHFVADHVTDLSAYGLDHPVLHLIINYYDPQAANASPNPSASDSPSPSASPNLDIIGQVDYIWGKTLDNGEIAFMKTGDTSVYSMDANFLEDLKKAATPFNLMDKFIAIPNIADVKSINIDFEGTKYELTCDDKNEKYQLDHQDVDQDNFKALYRNLIGITADIVLDEKNNITSPVITINYHLNDGSTVTGEFADSTNNQYYQSTLNNVLVGVTKTKLKAVKTALDDVKAGKILEK